MKLSAVLHLTVNPQFRRLRWEDQRVRVILGFVVNWGQPGQNQTKQMKTMNLWRLLEVRRPKQSLWYITTMHHCVTALQYNTIVHHCITEVHHWYITVVHHYITEAHHYHARWGASLRYVTTMHHCITEVQHWYITASLWYITTVHHYIIRYITAFLLHITAASSFGRQVERWLQRCFRRPVRVLTGAVWEYENHKKCIIVVNNTIRTVLDMDILL